MIDFSNFDKSSAEAWSRLAESLIIKGQSAVIAGNDSELKSLQQDFQTYAQEATLECPAPALTAVNRGQAQIAQARQALKIKSLAERGARLEVAAARMSSAVNELRATASFLKLEPIRKALDVATVAANQLKAVRNTFETAPKDDVKARLDAVLGGIDQVVDRLTETLVS